MVTIIFFFFYLPSFLTPFYRLLASIRGILPYLSSPILISVPIPLEYIYILIYNFITFHFFLSLSLSRDKCNIIRTKKKKNYKANFMENEETYVFFISLNIRSLLVLRDL